MSNTRKDRLETFATRAIKAMQSSLDQENITEVEAMLILRVITSQLEQVLKQFIDDGPKTP